MDVATFNNIISCQIEACEKTLIKKADEYATTDRLHNFRVAAALLGGTEEQALAGMLAKHVVSIFDMINSGNVHSMAMWDEKIGDAINYLLLLKAVVTERDLETLAIMSGVA